MNSSQVQLKISLSGQLNQLLAAKAAGLGVPVTQLVKHLIIKDVEDMSYPTFQMSEKSEKKAAEAMKEIERAVDASKFFKQLHES